jgi:hypothetical protein
VMIPPFADPIVDWATIGKVIAVALVSSVGIAIAFSIAVLGTTRSVELRRDGRSTGASVFALVGLAGAGVCIAAVVLGIIVMSSK